MLGEERGDVLESVLELAGINGVPYWADLALGNAAG